MNILMDYNTTEYIYIISWTVSVPSFLHLFWNLSRNEKCGIPKNISSKNEFKVQVSGS